MNYPICYTRIAGFALLIGASLNFSPAIADQALFQSDRLIPEELVRQVLLRHPQLRLKQAEVEISLARIAQVSALADPKISYSFAPLTGFNGDQDFGQKLMFSQQLPWPGKRELAAQTQTYKTNAVREQIDLDQLMLTLQAKNAFADWYFAHAALQINQQSKLLWDEFQHLAELNYAIGRSGKQDVLQAEVEAFRLEHRDISLLRKKKAARNRINELLNRTPDTHIPPPASLDLSSGSLLKIAELRQMALQNRPEIQVLQEKIKAAASHRKRVQLDDYPDFKLMAGWNSLWNDPDKRWTLGVSVNLPVFADKLKAAKGEAKAQWIRLQTDLDLLHNQIQSEVQNAFDDVIEAQHSLQLYQQKLSPLAKESLASSQTNYESGAGNFLSLIRAEKNLFAIKLEKEKAKTALYQSMAKLRKSVAAEVLQLTDKITHRNQPALNGGGL